MKVVEFADEARMNAAHIDACWRANGRAAPDLFTNELESSWSERPRRSRPSRGTAHAARYERLFLRYFSARCSAFR